MARIPDHEIERLKKEISVERLAEARGIQPARHGAYLVGKCPFHDDRTPSLVITPGKNLWQPGDYNLVTERSPRAREQCSGG